MRIETITSFIVVVPLLGCAGTNSAPFDGMVDVGSHALHTRIVGNGHPVVVIDGGIAARAEEWYALQDTLAARTQVVVYDRAGYGASEPGPLPRHSAREVGELKALLDAANVPGPYVLVGHSLGALNAQAFAASHPEAVAGLVLLDPPPLGWLVGDSFPELRRMADEMTEEWQGIADQGSDSESAAQRAEASFFSMIASEHREMFGESARLVEGIRSFGNLPLIVVASGIPNPAFREAAQDFQEFWANQSRALAEKSSQGEFVFAEESTHMLHQDAPHVVWDLVFSLLPGSQSP